MLREDRKGRGGAAVTDPTTYCTTVLVKHRYLCTTDAYWCFCNTAPAAAAASRAFDLFVRCSGCKEAQPSALASCRLCAT